MPEQRAWPQKLRYVVAENLIPINVLRYGGPRRYIQERPSVSSRLAVEKIFSEGKT